MNDRRKVMIKQEAFMDHERLLDKYSPYDTYEVFGMTGGKIIVESEDGDLVEFYPRYILALKN